MMRNMPMAKRNCFRLLINGEQFFPRVSQIINEAQEEVFLETFILFDDKVGRALRETLINAARRGVSIDVTVDGYGSDGLSKEFIQGLTQAGVRFHIFDPQPRLFGIRANIFRRMHRKIVSADGKVAVLGGINFSAQHLLDYGPEAKQDYAVEVLGPLAQEVHQFAKDALIEPGKAGRRRWTRVVRAAPIPEFGSNGRLVIRDNDWHPNDIEQAYKAGIQSAQKDIIIANGYFFPGYRLLRDIAQAARRGVQIRLIVQGEPDMQIARKAPRWLYHYLDDAGVKLYEYCRRPLHGKVACIDDAWSTIGSSNLDPFSLALNLEANIFAHDEALTTDLRAALERLLENDCEPVLVDRRKQGGLRRLWVAVVVFHFLRRFPAWSGMLPAHKPRLTSMVASTDVDHKKHDTP